MDKRSRVSRRFCRKKRLDFKSKGMTLKHPVQERIDQNKAKLIAGLKSDLELIRAIKLDLAKLGWIDEMPQYWELEKCLERSLLK